jgi:RNA polymerase sigma-70 factor (ECF subfamily)
METVLKDAARSALRSQAISLAEFDELVHQHQRRIYRLLYVLLRDRDEADSLTQECFLRAFQNLDRFRGECSVQTWLLRIAVNLARDHARSRKASFWKHLLGLGETKDGLDHFDFPAPGPTPEQAMLAQAEVQAIWKAVRDLSLQQQTVFTLRFVEELELSEIANVLNVQVGTVKTQLFRAVHAVRDTLREQQWR